MEFSTIMLWAVLPLVAAIYFLFGRNNPLAKIPGPRSLPILGNAHEIDTKKPHMTLSAWAKQYGAIFRIKLFGTSIVVVNSVEGIQELLVTKSGDFAGRTPLFRAQYLFNEDLAFTDFCPKFSWKKKMCMTELKQAGEGLKKLDNLTMTIIDKLASDLLTLNGQPVNIREHVFIAVAQVTFSMVYGRTLQKGDLQTLTEITSTTDEMVAPLSSGFELDILPWLQYFPNKSFYNMNKMKLRLEVFFHDQLTATMQAYNGNETKCVIDGLLRERQRLSADLSKPQLTIENINAICRGLLLAGIVTTFTALYYMIALLATHQDVQKEAYEHIIANIGHRKVNVKDRSSLPFIESILFETLRLMSHVPFAIPHKCMKGSSLLGYEIPKETQVWANLWYLHHDESLWTDPWSFKPKRFLDADGKLVLADHPSRKQFFAFGAGRRVCAGEAVARNRLFLFMVTLLQEIHFVPTDEAVHTDPRSFQFGLALEPSDYYIKVLKR